MPKYSMIRTRFRLGFQAAPPLKRELHIAEAYILIGEYRERNVNLAELASSFSPRFQKSWEPHEARNENGCKGDLTLLRMCEILYIRFSLSQNT